MDFHLLRAGPCEVARERQKVRAPVRRQAPLILFFSQARAGRGLFLSRLPLAADRRDDFPRLLHRRKGAIHRMARVARQEDNREVDGRDQEDYQIALPYSRIKILKSPV